MKIQRFATIALAVSGAISGVAMADDSTLTLYGILDAAVATAQHSYSVDPQFPASIAVTQINAVSQTAPKNANATGVNGMFNGGIQDSRWGLRGKEDLGDGLSAIFTLESGINLPTGQLNNAAGDLASNNGSSSAGANSSLSGQLFNRQAFVGLSDKDYGTLTFGRQYQPIYDILVTYDPVQFAQLFSPLGYSGSLGGGSGISEELRTDNTIKYANKIGAFNFGGQYKLGGIAGHNGARSDYALRLGYEDGPFGVQAAYERINDGLSEANDGFNIAALTPAAGVALPITTPNVKVTNQNSIGYLLAAKYHIGEGNIKVGYSSYTLGKPSDPFSSLNVTNLYNYPIGAASDLKVDRKTKIFYFGGDYNVMPKLNLAAGYYDVQLVKSADNGQLDGKQQYFSLLADYSLSKRTDVYAGALYQKLSGDNYPATTTAATAINAANKGSLGNAATAADYQSNKILAIGLRHKF